MVSHNSSTSFDVVILGSGISGSIMAAILAKQGVSVLLVDSDVHPRFAVGESTIPHTSLLISLLAEKYGIPELEHTVFADRLARHVCTTCGVKRTFGFAYHRAGTTYDRSEGLQFGTSAKDEHHWFRQDIDAYLFHVAIHYGAVPRQKTKVTTLEIDAHGARIGLSAGEEIRARYVIDGTGCRSVIAERYDLREKRTRLRHHSRTLFTHMIDVPAFDEEHNPLSVSWHQSTLHHCFERGWFWVIPFNNHEGSTNPLVSVGLTVDPRRYPKSEHSPQDEFRSFLQMFPSVAEQFADAKPVRPWVRTDRLQYSSKQTIGYRWCMMSHAAGAVDPLFSRGLINTLEVIHALLDPLLGALAEDDFDEARFAQIEPLQQRVLDYNDRLVNGAFISWADFDLWNAWLRVWGLGTLLTEFRAMNALADYVSTHDERYISGGTQNPVFSNFEDPDYAAFFTRATATIESFEAQQLSASEASDRIFGLANNYSFPVVIRRDAMLRAGWIKESDYMTERDIGYARRGFRWALTNPETRDLYGSSATFFRWCAKQPDPHLVQSLR